MPYRLSCKTSRHTHSLKTNAVSTLMLHCINIDMVLFRLHVPAGKVRRIIHVFVIILFQITQMAYYEVYKVI